MGKTESQCPLEVSFIAVRSVNILLTPPPTTPSNRTLKLLYNITILSYIILHCHYWPSSVRLIVISVDKFVTLLSLRAAQVATA